MFYAMPILSETGSMQAIESKKAAGDTASVQQEVDGIVQQLRLHVGSLSYTSLLHTSACCTPLLAAHLCLPSHITVSAFRTLICPHLASGNNCTMGTNNSSTCCNTLTWHITSVLPILHRIIKLLCSAAGLATSLATFGDSLHAQGSACD